MKRNVHLSYFFVLVTFGLTICMAEDVSNIIQKFLPKEFQNSNITIDNVKQLLKEKCKKASGTYNETLYADIESASTTLMECLSAFGNVSAITEEIQKAPLGGLDDVFEKYCHKVPEAQLCLQNFNAKIKPCLTVKEQQQNEVLFRMVKGLAKFACSDGGGTIALFFAEDGPQCLEANKEAISQCAKSAFVEFLPSANSRNATDSLNLPEFVLSPEHCVDLLRFESCTLHHIEQCREVTPANVAESVFKFIKNETACKEWLTTRSSQRSVLKDQNSPSNTIQISFLLFFIAAFYNSLLLISN